jgi:aspartyl-tRNA synthetase
MQRTLVQALSSHVGEQVLLKGWVHALRHQGGIKFLILRDQTGLIQTVILRSNTATFTAAEDLHTESVVAITGTVKAEAQAPGGIEVLVERLDVLSHAAPSLPIPVVAEKGSEATDPAKRFDWRWLDLRQPDKRAIFQTWTELERGFRAYWAEAGYIQIYAPSLMSMASEGGSEVFEVKYFDRKAYLAQSPQFYKQMAMAAGIERVCMVGPVFRAEPSFTTRHMTEFTGWDFEIAFVDSHYDVMAQEEQMLVRGFEYAVDNAGADVAVPALPFPKMTMAEAKAKLSARGVTSARPGDLSPEEEREISRLVKDETGHDFVFITDYPATVRPFYHMRLEGDPAFTRSFDLLYRGIEITTGAQREHRPDVLERQALEKGVLLDTIQTYVEFFRYGCPPHGGAGIGPGRIVMAMLELPSVKEATFLPRDVRRLIP